jgi:hypothetical protein
MVRPVHIGARGGVGCGKDRVKTPLQACAAEGAIHPRWQLGEVA